MQDDQSSHSSDTKNPQDIPPNIKNTWQRLNILRQKMALSVEEVAAFRSER